MARTSSRTRRLTTALFVLLALALPASAAWKEKVLYSFTGGSDGSTPAGGVVFDSTGNLYGANILGGAKGSGCPSGGCGVVFEISPPKQKGGAWTQATIYTFQGFNQGNDGFSPYGGLIIDAKGNLYGTTAYGGTGSCTLLGGRWGCGTAYELSPPQQKGGKWTEKILYSLQGGKDGYFAWGDLVFDANGNLYGATQFGGGKGTSCNILYGGQCGTVFEISPPKTKGGKWTEKVLHSFAGGTRGEKSSDGATPNGGLILDSKGVVYGTTYYGGDNAGNCGGGVNGIGCGTVFELLPPKAKGGAWAEAVLHRFGLDQDGSNPADGMVFGEDGNPYGTTYYGPPNDYGTIFVLTKHSGRPSAWTESVLYRFKDGKDGANPAGRLIFDRDGNLYGTAERGTWTSVYGDVFKLKAPTGQASRWTLDVLHGFATRSGGGNPSARLVSDANGNYYSTTGGGGGPKCGTCGIVFEVSP
jgi:hypothetical protein